MKLLHFADLHLGIDTHGSIDSATGLSTRIGDTLNAFDAIIDTAINEQVDAVLFAGDAFKNRDPNPTLQREFARRISRLALADIPTVLLIGNHDMPGVASRATAADIYEVLAVPGIYVSREIETLNLSTRSGALQVVTLPWVTRSILLARDEFRQFADRALDEEISLGVSAAVQNNIESLDPAIPAVLVAHVSIQGAHFGFERSIMLGRDVTVGPDDLHASAFDYVALGHIHKHQTLGTRPPVIYAGSPERVDFGEESEDKGFVLVDIEAADGGISRSTSWNFHTLPARDFVTIRINARGVNPELRVKREIERRATDIQDSIVRCYIEVDEGLESSISALDARRILNAQGPSHIAQVVVESDASIRARLDVSEEDALDIRHMLERWLEMRDYDPDYRERILRLGIELIDRQREEAS